MDGWFEFYGILSTHRPYSGYIHQTNKCGKLLGEDSAEFFAIALRVII